MKKKSCTMATALLFAMLLSIFLPATTLSASALPTETNMVSSYSVQIATSNTEIGPVEGCSLKAVNLEYASAASNLESSRAVENPKAPQIEGTFTVKGRFWYANEGGGWSPGRYMWARVRDADDAGFSVSQWTDANGYFTFVIANPLPLHRSPILDFIAEGQWDWKTTNDAGAQYWWSTGVLKYDVPDGWVYENNGLGASVNADALQAGDAVYAEAQWIYDRTGWMRSKVQIRWPSGTWAHSHGNEIHLPLKSTGAWNHVTVHHEEAHCVMWALYGHWPPGSGPSPHYIFSESSNGFAITEGWAEFMMCAVDNNPNNWVDWYNGHGGNMETNDWYNCIDTGDLDGAIIEGSIASILWDINDPVNIAGDNDHMGWGFDEIFTVMRYDQPDTIWQFWDKWKARWPTVSTSVGPLCDIYWNYGIDEDYLPWGQPWGGTITINAGATYTTSRTVTLTLFCDDWGSGVRKMRFSNDIGATWSAWVTYATTYSYYMANPGDGYKYVDVQYADYWSQVTTALTIWDGILLDTVAPVTTISHSPGSSTVSLSATDATSGVLATYYRIDLGAWITYAGPFTLTGTGTHTIDYYSKDKAGNNEATKQLKVHYLTVNTDPAGITTISGTGWYNQGTTAATGTAPATVTVGGITYTFSAWKKDGAPVGGNPISVFMDAPHTATAVYIAPVTASFKIWTDKTVYNIGQTMKVYVRVKNPSFTPLPVRAKIFLKLPGGALYGPLLDLTTTLPALFDSGDVLWQSFTIPSVPLGFYGWVAELRNPTTNALITQDTWNWELA